MFDKFLENVELSLQDQKKIFKQIIEKHIKTNKRQVKNEIQKSYDKLKPVMLKHWKKSLKIIFLLLNRVQVVDYLEGKRDNCLLDLLLAINKDETAPELRCQYFMDLQQRFQDIWKYLIILRVSAQCYSLSLTHVDAYTWFLASFIRISAASIQMYLQTKNQPIKSSQDRVHQDIILVNNCQAWITHSYLLLFLNLKIIYNTNTKNIIFTALSHICGALEETQRQGNLNPQCLCSIMKAVHEYSLKCYSLTQVIQLFAVRLRINKFANPVSKIQIPHVYDQNTKMNTIGACSIIYKHLELGQHIYSVQNQLDILMIMLSQLLPTSYKLKIDIINKCKFILTLGHIFSSRFQVTYPLALLLFNIHYFYKAQFDFFASKLNFSQDSLKKINRLKLLQKINIYNLNIQKGMFIIHSLQDKTLYFKETLLLIKNLEFKFTNELFGNVIIQCIEKLIKMHGQITIQIIKEKISQQKILKQNEPLCDKLQKLCM